jgi:hypothetical protein
MSYVCPFLPIYRDFSLGFEEETIVIKRKAISKREISRNTIIRGFWGLWNDILSVYYLIIRFEFEKL